MTQDQLIHAIDLVGTGSFAVSGALRAVDKKPDIVGMLILATVTAVGGGVLRDLVLQRPVAFMGNGGYASAIILCTVAVFIFPSAMLRRETVFKYFDAIGLGVFAANTASAAWHTPGIHPLAILLMATLAACFGGILRDLMIGKTTLVLSPEIYVTPVIFGTSALMFVEWAGGARTLAFFTAMAITTLFRMAAIAGDWRLPRALSAPGASFERY